jgi:glucokinase
MQPATHYVGVEVGGTKLQAALGDGAGRIDDLRRATANASGGAEAIRDQVRQLVAPWLKAANVNAIGFGFGGPVDEAAGRVIRSHQVGGWASFKFVDWALEAFGVPCALANDSDLAAWAEARIGAGRGCARVFYTNIGSGIGGGLVVDGRRYVAPGGCLEFGQTWAYSELEQRWDRLERLCSGWAIEHRAAANGVSFETARGAIAVLEGWQRGDRLAVQLMDDWMTTYARAVANAISLLNPDAVIVGGGVAEFGAPLLSAIRTTVAPLVFEPFSENYTIVRAALGEASVPTGALLMAAELNGRTDESAPAAAAASPS